MAAKPGTHQINTTIAQAEFDRWGKWCDETGTPRNVGLTGALRLYQIMPAYVQRLAQTVADLKTLRRALVEPQDEAVLAAVRRALDAAREEAQKGSRRKNGKERS